MVSEAHGVTGSACAGYIKDGLSSATNHSVQTDNIGGSNPYFVIDGPGGGDYVFEFSSDFTNITVRGGLHWDDGEQAFTHPDDSFDDTECESPPHPGQLFNESGSFMQWSNGDGSVWYGPGYAVVRPYGDWDALRFATVEIDHNSQEFSETLQCTDSDGNDYTVETTGYNGVMKACFLLQGNTFYYTTWGTTTGDFNGGDVATRLTGGRRDANVYEREEKWDVKNHNGSVIGSHDEWVDTSNDGGPLMNHLGTMEANGTYITIIPSRNNTLFRDT